MRIAIDLTSLSYHMTGIERYAACMTEEMLKLDISNEYVLIFRNEVFPVFEQYIDQKRVKVEILRGRNKMLFLQLVLAINLYRIKADKYIFFAFTSPIIFRKKGIINTIHDMGAWDAAEAMTCLQKLYWRTTYRISAKNSERIITVSEFSKGRISDILHYSPQKIDVVYSAVYKGVTKDYGYSFDDVREKYQLPKQYIMTLSTLEPRKNMELLLKAFTNIQDKVDYDLVLVGRKGWKIDEVLERYNSKTRIHITGYVEDEHISVIYKNAKCFVFPSLYEGFGLPPVEALALGTPVIASDAASIPEILMDSATYFHNNSDSELSDLLIDINSKLSTFPRKLNLYQKENYSFKKSANKILGIISR